MASRLSWSCFIVFFGLFTASRGTPVAATTTPAAVPTPFGAAPAPYSKPPTQARPDTSATGTVVAKWKDNKKAVFMVAFDDSEPCDLTNVIPELMKRKLVGNFYVNAGLPAFNDRKAQWIEAAKSPYIQLCNHTWTHKGVNSPAELVTELEKDTQAIYECTPGQKTPRLVGFGQPGGVPWKVTNEETMEGLEKDNLVSRPSFYGLPFHYHSGAELVKVVDDAIAKGAMGHIDFHGVGGDWLSVPTEFLTTLLDKLVAEDAKVWISSTVDWRKYVEERQTADIKVLSSDTSTIKLQLTCAADPALYDLPLTLLTKVPADWTQCTVTQGATKTVVNAKDGQIMYDALAGNEPVVITKG